MSTTMIGRGLYDAAEVAMLCGLNPDSVVRWSTPNAHGNALVSPSFGRQFSFDELVAFTVAKQVRSHGVSDPHVRHGVDQLRLELGVNNPLAREHVIARLATDGDSLLWHLDDNEFKDIGRGVQGTFRDVVSICLKHVVFNETGNPLEWIPVDGVYLNPEVQAGSPCIAGTRIPTQVVAARAAFETPKSIAFDLDLTLSAIEAAVRFEELLAEGAGIPA